MALGTSTAACVVGAVCTLGLTPKRFRSTFYEHHTLTKYIREYVWCKQTTLKIDGELVVCDRELVQAYDTIGVEGYARCYWPMDLVEPFVRENWCVISPCNWGKILSACASVPKVAMGAREALLVHRGLEGACPARVAQRHRQRTDPTPQQLHA